MGARAVLLEGVVLLLWASLCFYYHVVVIGFDILFSILGVVSGLIIGTMVALRYLKSLEEKGEFQVTLKIGALTLLTLIIVIPIAIYLILSYGLIVGIPMLSFVYPCLPALYAARIILYLNWERKHKKHILFDGRVLTRVYAAPRSGSG
jgi:peptidoglycan/LPS O-acetylase OafA/YrhL